MPHVKTVDETPEVRARWLEVLRAQGRKLTWLAEKTNVSYPMATHYAQGRTKPPDWWLDKVSEVLGEDVR